MKNLNESPGSWASQSSGRKRCPGISFLLIWGGRIRLVFRPHFYHNLVKLVTLQLCFLLYFRYMSNFILGNLSFDSNSRLQKDIIAIYAYMFIYYSVVYG